MAKGALRDGRLVLLDARHALSMTQREFGEALMSSHRTASRWDAGRAAPASSTWEMLAGLLVSCDRPLAAEAAAHAGKTLEELGLVSAPPSPPPRPASAPAPPAKPTVGPEHLVDVVVCAVAEALDQSPRPLRPLLYAAFKKAREVGLTVEDAERALAPSGEGRQ